MEGVNVIVLDPDDPVGSDDGLTGEAETAKSVMWKVRSAVVCETGVAPINAVPFTLAV